MGYQSGSLYYYRPTLSAAILCACISAILGVFHGVRTYRSKSWRYTLPVALCAFEITAGLVIRAVSSYKFSNLGLFVTESVLIQIAPPLLALALYLTLARALYYIPWLSPIHPGRVRTTYIGLDGLLGALLASGAARVSNTGISVKEREVGEILIKAGMVLQCVLMSSFIILCAVFYGRCRQHGVVPKIDQVMQCLLGCAGCILLRTIVRTVEFYQSYLGVLATHEAYFYCLDIIWVIFAMILFYLRYPGKQLPQCEKTYLTPDGETEKEGPGWDDPRRWFVTVLDPFDLAALFGKKQRATRFWEDSANHHEVKSSPIENVDGLSARPKDEGYGRA